VDENHLKWSFLYSSLFFKKGLKYVVFFFYFEVILHLFPLQWVLTSDDFFAPEIYIHLTQLLSKTARSPSTRTLPVLFQNTLKTTGIVSQIQQSQHPMMKVSRSYQMSNEMVFPRSTSGMDLMFDHPHHHIWSNSQIKVDINLL